MADTLLPAGSTIDFTITLSEPVSTFDNIFVTLYGDSKSSTYKHIYALVDDEENPKYSPIQQTGESELTVKALSAHTAKMLGRLMYEIKLVTEYNDIDFEDVGSNIPVDTTIVLVDNKSKTIRP